MHHQMQASLFIPVAQLFYRANFPCIPTGTAMMQGIQIWQKMDLQVGPEKEFHYLT
jgi:hypothetical protein